MQCPKLLCFRETVIWWGVFVCYDETICLLAGLLACLIPCFFTFLDSGACFLDSLLACFLLYKHSREINQLHIDGNGLQLLRIGLNTRICQNAITTKLGLNFRRN